LPIAAEDDAAIEHRFEPVLDRADQERPADRFADEDRDEERGDRARSAPTANAHRRATRRAEFSCG
jgi:hypothetical protein